MDMLQREKKHAFTKVVFSVLVFLTFHAIDITSSLSRGVLDCPNFGCFPSSRCQHFHCIAMRNSIKAGMNWHKMQEIEHIPALITSL